jgi:hypothetical protein
MFAASKTASVSGGYQISRSLRFNSADSAYLNRTPAGAGNRTTWTWSGWVKRASFGSSQVLFGAGPDGSNYTIFYFSGTISEDLEIFNYTGGATTGYAYTTSVFRDPSAWYHVVLAVDTTQGTSADRTKIYVNNVLQPITISTTFGSSVNTWVNTNNSHRLGSTPTTSALYGGYMTDVNFVDGSQLTPSSFGETDTQTGVWKPKAYSGSYGTNGFYLNFSDNSNTTAATLGKDYSGNGNNWTPNNFSVTAGAGNDSLVDSPTSYGTDTGVGGTVRGNYATLNPLALKSAVTLTNGNLDGYSVGSTDICYATIGMSSGKWYWEVTCISGGPYMIGISKDVTPLADWQTTNGLAYFGSNGQKYTNSAGTAYGATFTTGDVIGLALDMDAGTLVFYKNGTSQGTAFTGITGTYFASLQNPGANGTMSFNFGQRAFANTAPSGFKALCTQNLPTPTIGATTATQAGKYFNPVLYAGNGGTQSVTGVGFQPDFVWVKNRTNANGHGFEDVLRGAGYTLASDSTSAEINYSNYFTAFTSDGFNMALGGGTFNGSGSNYVAWNWKANGSGSTNTSGSITSTVSANTTSGFSVVTYTGNGTGGATIGHGLGVAPRMIIIKCRSDASGWAVYQADVGNTKYLRLDGTDAANTASTLWNNTSPTSSVFSVGTDGWVNGSARTYVAYCFAPVAGYSAFGSYTGNGSADGPFVYTGFRPAFLMIKRSSSTGDWFIYNNKTSLANVVAPYLVANTSGAEGTYTTLDFLSNGFKLRVSDAEVNGNGSTIIFMAFAENPFKTSLAR